MSMFNHGCIYGVSTVWVRCRAGESPERRLKVGALGVWDRIDVTLPNIAEGSSRSSRLDFARFIEIATGSVFEVVSQATLCKRLGFLSEESFGRVYAAAEKRSRMLSGLRRPLDAA